MQTIVMGFTPDPDDAFAAYALALGKVPADGFRFLWRTGPIEELNRLCSLGAIDVAAVSSVYYPFIQETHDILRMGASVGRGYGPLLAAREPRTLDDLARGTIAVPGKTTTGAALVGLLLPGAATVACPLAEVVERVRSGAVDAGVLIHEDLLNSRHFGLHDVACLGREWQRRTGLPLPVGLNVIRRDLGPELCESFARSLRLSIAYALRRPEEAFRWARSFGRSPTEARSLEFTRMFANEDTRHLPADCELGLRRLFSELHQAGIAPPVRALRFVEGAPARRQEVICAP
jgi:1,4-dihydroxy-6-naphthoate synthase